MEWYLNGLAHTNPKIHVVRAAATTEDVRLEFYYSTNNRQDYFASKEEMKAKSGPNSNFDPMSKRQPGGASTLMKRQKKSGQSG